MTFNYRITLVVLVIAVAVAMIAAMINVGMYLNTLKKKGGYTKEISPEYIKNRINALISVIVIVLSVSAILYLQLGFINMYTTSDVNVYTTQKLTSKSVDYNNCHYVIDNIHCFKENNEYYRDCVYELVDSTIREYNILGIKVNFKESTSYRTLYTSAELCKTLRSSTGNLYAKEG